MKTMMVATSPNYKYLFIDEKFITRITHKEFNDTFTPSIVNALRLTGICYLMDEYRIGIDVYEPMEAMLHGAPNYVTPKEFLNVYNSIEAIGKMYISNPVVSGNDIKVVLKEVENQRKQL